MTPKEAYEHAIRYGSSNKAREIACKDPLFTYQYARLIDKCPRNDTRIAACKHSSAAYLYAKDIDKGFHQDTYEATINTKYEEDYKKLMNNHMKEEII